MGISELVTNDPKAHKVADRMLRIIEQGNRKRLKALAKLAFMESKRAGAAGKCGGLAVIHGKD